MPHAISRSFVLLLLASLATPFRSFAAEESAFAPNAKPALLQEKGAGEGPVWWAMFGVLTSGDGNVNRRDEEGKQTVYREGAGTNGLAFDNYGRLTMCEAANRRVTRVEGEGPPRILAERFDGKRFNQPNDLVYDAAGRLYFSDPCYGDRSKMEMTDADGKLVEGVYRIDPDGKVSRIIAHEVDRPNGLAISPDGKQLYVADNNNDTEGGARKLWRFDLSPAGFVVHASRTLIHDWGKTRGPDGMKFDSRGRLFVAAGLNKPNPPFEIQDEPTAGIYVFSPAGKLLEFMPVPRDEVTNCAFGGGDGRTLYITAGGSLWSVRTAARGAVNRAPPGASMVEKQSLGETVLRSKRILLLGDSVTASGKWAAIFDAWLYSLRRPVKPLVIDCGLSSETVSGLSEEGHAGGKFPRPDLAERLDRVLETAKPDLVIACYGINCAIYEPFDEQRFQRYQAGIENLMSKVESAGSKLILVTPPFYDDQQAPKGFSYNEVIAKYGALLQSYRTKGCMVIDLHGRMTADVERRRQKDPKYTMQPDGVHPNDEGDFYIGRTIVAFCGERAALTAKNVNELLAANRAPPGLLPLVQQRVNVLRDAYVSAAGHKRPGVAPGLPIPEAERKAAELEAQIVKLLGK